LRQAWFAFLAAVAVAACGGDGVSGPAPTTTTVAAATTTTLDAAAVQALFDRIVDEIIDLPTAYFSDDQSDVAARWMAGAVNIARSADSLREAGLASAAAHALDLATTFDAVGVCIARAETPAPLAARSVDRVCAGLWKDARDQISVVSEDALAALGD